MDIESSLSRAGTIKGVALELPFLKFKYVKVENAASEEATRRRVNTVVDNQEERKSTQRTSTVQFVQPAQINTLGLDPMVSSASVIHELAYGRSGDDAPVIHRPAAKYYSAAESSPSSLSIVV